MTQQETRYHYLRIARDRIDEQIRELKERQAEIDVEVIRAGRKLNEGK